MTRPSKTPEARADLQETLPGTGGTGGIWSRYLDNACAVDDGAWRLAIATKQHVGKCRRCGNPLAPGRPYRVGPVAWYPADCTAPGCDYQTAAHGPKPEKKTNGR